MVFDGSISLKPQPVTNGFVIAVSFFVVPEAGCKMGRYEDNGSVGVFHPNSYSTFVSSYA
jgi:hypothetical protein